MQIYIIITVGVTRKTKSQSKSNIHI